MFKSPTRLTEAILVALIGETFLEATGWKPGEGAHSTLTMVIMTSYVL